MRHISELRFYYDDSFDTGMRVSELLSDLDKRDRRLVQMSKRKSGCNIHGILLLDKRLGVSSNRALQEVRRLFNANKAGHTGSLDPLATGLLPLCFGEATKVSALMLDDNKRYQVVVQLGVMTDTGDAEGAVIETKPVPELSIDDIQACLEKFTGEIDQVPPMYSALKHNGKKLYELAREGKTVERKARRITIFELKLLTDSKLWLRTGSVDAGRVLFKRHLYPLAGGRHRAHFGLRRNGKGIAPTGSGSIQY